VAWFKSAPRLWREMVVRRTRPSSGGVGELEALTYSTELLLPVRVSCMKAWRSLTLAWTMNRSASAWADAAEARRSGTEIDAEI
jgi:hypothetical protein